MFPWSVVFLLEPKVPGQRSPEELVTNTLMLELGAMVKHTEHVRLERAAQVRRRRSSSLPGADYSWLAGPQARVAYQITPTDVLELQALCAQIPPAQCGPVMVRFRKLVTEIEPEVDEVPRLFHMVLRNCLEEAFSEEELRVRASCWHRQRSQSLSHTFRSKFRTFHRGWGGSRGNLREEAWSDEDVEADEEVVVALVRNRGRSLSMPDIIPLEQTAELNQEDREGRKTRKR